MTHVPPQATGIFARSLRASPIDLLVLGGLADRVRKAERGDVVRLHLDPPEDGLPCFGPLAEGMAPPGASQRWLRELALVRLAAAPGSIVRIDAEAVGLQLSQVALAFGADELFVPVRRMSVRVAFEDEADDQAVPLRRHASDPRLASLANGNVEELRDKLAAVEHERAILRERELADLVRSAGRKPRIVEWPRGVASERDPDAGTVVRRFRAPGREVKELEELEAARRLLDAKLLPDSGK